MTSPKIELIGLGYVGLPLAVGFAKKYPVDGFDNKTARIQELSMGQDNTLEVETSKLKSVITTSNQKEKNGLFFSSSLIDIKDCNIFIISVQTPTDKYNRPDLTPLYKASDTVGKVFKHDDMVIYESTVYPGVTEDECIPVLEKVSGLKYNSDFFAGYSPELINPGDKEHTITKIRKVTSGSTSEIVDQLYKSIIVAGTLKASSIKVAESAKVIENTQRDINIAFVNELSKIFTLLGIDTNEVLEAAGTKWNFLKFKPGLVGGHCIGVDPYYLAQKAQEVGYHPEIILAGRRINDSMGKYVAGEVIKLMVKKGLTARNANILILGITFKENCPDVRNTKVVDIINALDEYHVNINIYDPWANPSEVKHEYNVTSLQKLPQNIKYDAIVLAVAHNEFEKLNLKQITNPNAVIFDVKSILPKNEVDGRL